jgi:glycosyltransferase involved in cell wall biosynthesis
MDSVLGQTDTHTEYIVMDGGSNDGSQALIESHADRLAYWQSCPDGGPAAALQHSLGRCSGDYFIYLNSDDFLLPGALDRLRRAIGQSPHIDVFYGNGLTLDERTGSLRKTYSDRWNTKAYARGGISIFQQSCALKLNAMKRVGGFNLDNSTCWDGELLFDLALSGARFKRLNEFQAVFRLHDASISGSQTRQQIYRKDCERIASKLGSVHYRGPGIIASIRKMFRQPDIVASKVIDSLLGRSGSDLLPKRAHEIAGVGTRG